MEEKCWNISQETNDITASVNGGLAVAKGLEAKVVELRARLYTLIEESDDGVSGLNARIIFGDSPLYAKQGEIERCARTVPGVLAVKTTDIRMDKVKRTLSFFISVVFDEGTVEFNVDTGE